MNVSAEDRDGRGRLAAEPVADVAEEFDQLLERTLKGRPVLEVNGASQALAEPRRS